METSTNTSWPVDQEWVFQSVCSFDGTLVTKPEGVLEAFLFHPSHFTDEELGIQVLMLSLETLKMQQKGPNSIFFPPFLTTPHIIVSAGK